MIHFDFKLTNQEADIVLDAVNDKLKEALGASISHNASRRKFGFKPTDPIFEIRIKMLEDIMKKMTFIESIEDDDE